MFQRVVYVAGGAALGALGMAAYQSAQQKKPASPTAPQPPTVPGQRPAPPMTAEQGTRSLTHLDKAKEIVPFGFPGPVNDLLYRTAYVSSFNRQFRNPNWVAEHITKESLKRGDGVDRGHSQFKEDAEVPGMFRSRLADYYKSNYDRGHMVPAADVKTSQEAMDETFLLTNIAPQVGEGFNRDYWAHFENFCRTLAQKYSDVWVFTGPLYLPQQDPRDQKWYVRYQVIGNPPNVAVPTHFFKVVLTRREDGSYASGAFVLPNAPIPDATPLERFIVPLEAVERAAGLQFYPELEKRQALRQLCSETKCETVLTRFHEAQKKPALPAPQEISSTPSLNLIIHPSTLPLPYCLSFHSPHLRFLFFLSTYCYLSETDGEDVPPPHSSSPPAGALGVVLFQVQGRLPKPNLQAGMHVRPDLPPASRSAAGVVRGGEAYAVGSPDLTDAGRAIGRIYTLCDVGGEASRRPRDPFLSPTHSAQAYVSLGSYGRSAAHKRAVSLLVSRSGHGEWQMKAGGGWVHQEKFGHVSPEATLTQKIKLLLASLHLRRCRGTTTLLQDVPKTYKNTLSVPRLPFSFGPSPCSGSRPSSLPFPHTHPRSARPASRYYGRPIPTPVSNPPPPPRRNPIEFGCMTRDKHTMPAPFDSRKVTALSPPAGPASHATGMLAAGACACADPALSPVAQMGAFTPVILIHNHHPYPSTDPVQYAAHKRHVQCMLAQNASRWASIFRDVRDHEAKMRAREMERMYVSPRSPGADSAYGSSPTSSDMAALDAGAGKGGKRRRGNLPKPTTAILRAWLNGHLQHPYPTETEKHELARQTKLTLNQISNWFINARRRYLRPLMRRGAGIPLGPRRGDACAADARPFPTYAGFFANRRAVLHDDEDEDAGDEDEEEEEAEAEAEDDEEDELSSAGEERPVRTGLKRRASSGDKLYKQHCPPRRVRVMPALSRSPCCAAVLDCLLVEFAYPAYLAYSRLSHDLNSKDSTLPGALEETSSLLNVESTLLPSASRLNRIESVLPRRIRFVPRACVNRLTLLFLVPHPLLLRFEARSPPANAATGDQMTGLK
ncbi:uncharacterized protein VTP21DRAFT_6426 [Calcarisporiella thermophila]|uniref:uncharacterized protein n=1 Tax=Calcarisporiella thermophila TaxID=911321 RepID=UPI00374234A2